MKKYKFGSFAAVLATAFISLALSASVIAQKAKPAKTPAAKATSAKLPEVKQIDAVGLKEAIKPAGRPRLVNFWATWCEPCRDEFPDLVKVDNDYRGRIDVISISLDDLAEIKRDVPIFLAEMKAGMPAFLLKTPDEDAAIAALDLPWHGALPFTVLYNEKGEVAYVRPGKIKPELLKIELDKLAAPAAETPAKPSK